MQFAGVEVGTLVALLRERVSRYPERLAYLYLDAGGDESDRRTCGELDRQARAVATRLQEHVAPGQRALLLFPPASITSPPSSAASMPEWWRCPPTRPEGSAPCLA